MSCGCGIESLGTETSGILVMRMRTIRLTVVQDGSAACAVESFFAAISEIAKFETGGNGGVAGD